MTATASSTRMTAVRHRAFGDPARALDVAPADIPTPGPGQVLVRVAAAGISIGDWLMMEGLPYIARPSHGLRRPKRPVLGQELAGTVEAVGAGVDSLSPGDRVLGFAAGAFAEHAVAEAEHLVTVPDGVSFVDATAVPVSALAAYQAVVGVGGTRPGQRVLVLGASGAVGTFAVQVAKATGAHVTAVASSRNQDLLRGLGADRVVDYAVEDVTATGDTWDVAIDLAGNRPLTALRRALTPTGTAVMVGGSGGRATMGFGRTVRAMLVNPFVKQRLVPLMSAPDAADLAAVRDLLAEGRLTPAIDRTFPLDAAAAAMDHVGGRHTQGKSVIVVDA